MFDPKFNFEFLVQSSSDAIITVGLDQKITSWNKAAEKIYGYSKKEVLGKKIDIIPPKNRKHEIQQFLKKLKAGKQIRNFETERLRKDGTLIHVSISISPVKDNKGKIIGFSAIVRDISEHEKMERKLKLMSEALEKAPDGIQITDLKGKIIYSNRAVKDIYGFSPKEYLGKNVNEMNTDPEFADKVILPSLRKTGRWNGEIMVKHKNGTIFPIWLTASMIKDSKRNPTALVGVIRDITAHKRLDDLKTEFLSVASHELKTPLSTLKLAVEGLMKKCQKEEKSFGQFKYIKLIDKELDHLKSLINELLDISRIETGKMVFRIEKVEISSLIKSVMEKMKLIAEKRKLTFKKPQRFLVMADLYRLEQVLVNLIANAIKCSPDKSEIAISVKKQKNKVVVSVKDRGTGIPKEKLPFIFDKFYQVKKQSPTGFGLGLYISREIIEQHKGKIWAESKLGSGSSFFFSLPLAKRG